MAPHGFFLLVGVGLSTHRPFTMGTRGFLANVTGGTEKVQSLGKTSKTSCIPGPLSRRLHRHLIVVPRGDVQGSGGESIKVAYQFATKVLMAVRMRSGRSTGGRHHAPRSSRGVSECARGCTLHADKRRSEGRPAFQECDLEIHLLPHIFYLCPRPALDKESSVKDGR